MQEVVQPADQVQATERVPSRSPRLFTSAESAELLAVPESWLRRKAGLRLIPCTKLGKHLRFSTEDLTQIAKDGQQTVRPQRRFRRSI